MEFEKKTFWAGTFWAIVVIIRVLIGVLIQYLVDPLLDFGSGDFDMKRFLRIMAIFVISSVTLGVIGLICIGFSEVDSRYVGIEESESAVYIDEEFSQGNYIDAEGELHHNFRVLHTHRIQSFQIDQQNQVQIHQNFKNRFSGDYAKKEAENSRFQDFGHFDSRDGEARLGSRR